MSIRSTRDRGAVVSLQKMPVFFAGAFLFLLFPGYYLYHFAVGSGWMVPFLGGWFGILAACGAVLLSPFGLRSALHVAGRLARFVSVFGLLVLYVGLWIVMYYLFGNGPQQSSAALLRGLELIAFWISLFLIGFFADIRGRWIWYALVAGFVAMSGLTLLNIDPNAGMLGLSRQSVLGQDVSTYQGFARSVVVVAVVLLAFCRKTGGQTLTLVVGIISLYFVGARSEFYGFILVGILWMKRLIIRSASTQRLVVFVAIALLLVVVLSTDSIRGNRQLGILDLSADTSWQVRTDLLEEGALAIWESPLAGEYAGQLLEDNIGGYIHNGLSAWRQFGLVGCVLFCAVMFASLAHALVAVGLRRRTNPQWIAALYLNVLCVVLTVVAKSVFWALPALAWGFTAAALSQESAAYRSSQ